MSSSSSTEEPRTSDLPLRERPRGVPVGYGAPATIVVTVIVRFCGAMNKMVFGKLGIFSSKLSLTNFDSPGQFLTLGDKTALFFAVFLKKVRVY